jgi:hypothetical protein
VIALPVRDDDRVAIPEVHAEPLVVFEDSRIVPGIEEDAGRRTR